MGCVSFPQSGVRSICVPKIITLMLFFSVPMMLSGDESVGGLFHQRSQRSRSLRVRRQMSAWMFFLCNRVLTGACFACRCSNDFDLQVGVRSDD